MIIFSVNVLQLQTNVCNSIEWLRVPDIVPVLHLNVTFIEVTRDHRENNNKKKQQPLFGRLYHCGLYKSKMALLLFCDTLQNFQSKFQNTKHIPYKIT